MPFAVFRRRLAPLVYEIFSVSVAKFRWAQYTRDRFEHLQGWLREGRWTSKLIPVGWAGVVVVTAIPFAGGVWTGVALSRAIAMSRKASLWAVGVGSIIGCGIFLFAALGVMHLASITAEPVMSN